MTFIAYFFLLILFLSVSELFLLVRVASEIGFFATMGLCVLTGIVGGAIVRYQGLQALARVRRELAVGRLPADELLGGVALIIVGALLCVPGFITDVLGFLMLIPQVRRSVVRGIKNKVTAGASVHVRPPQPGLGDREVIDVEYEEKPPGGRSPG